MDFDVVTVGGAKLDIILDISDQNKGFRFDEKTREIRIPFAQKLAVDGAEFTIGGNACNVGVGLRRLGFKVAVVAEIGDDEFSEKILKTLKSENVETGFIIKTPNSQSSFSVILNYKGDRTVIVDRVERKHDFRFEGLSSNWIYLTSIGKEWETAYQRVFEYVKNTGAKLAFNPDIAQMEKTEAILPILKETEVVLVNKEEALQIVNSKSEIANRDIRSLLSKIKSLGPRIVVITDGENGSYALDKNGNYFERGIVHVDIVGKVGAGDAYSSGFLGAIISGEDVEHAMNWGTANAASVIGKIGAENGLLRIDEIKKHHA